jgi:hypothetical protein
MPEIVDICPICDRDMWKGPSIDKHHMVPKCRGGRETQYLHRICHRKIHSIWTEKELEKEFNDPEVIKKHPEIQKFIKWIKKKEPDYYDRNEQHNRKK